MGFYSSQITSEEDLDRSSVMGVCHAKKNQDLPLPD